MLEPVADHDVKIFIVSAVALSLMILLCLLPIIVNAIRKRMTSKFRPRDALGCPIVIVLNKHFSTTNFYGGFYRFELAALFYGCLHADKTLIERLNQPPLKKLTTSRISHFSTSPLHTATAAQTCRALKESGY